MRPRGAGRSGSDAGGAYGVAYWRTGNLAAPILCRFLVDVTWRGFWAGTG